MATVRINVCTTHGRAATGATQPLSDSVPADSEIITSSGVSQTSTIAGGADGTWQNRHWSIESDGGAVLVAFGASPTASATSPWVVRDGETRTWAVTGPDERVAIINAA